LKRTRLNPPTEGAMSNFVYVLFAVSAIVFLGLAAAGYLSNRRLPKI